MLREKGLHFLLKKANLLEKIGCMEPPCYDYSSRRQLRADHVPEYRNRKLNILSANAPTLFSLAEVKDRFYEDLDNTIKDIPKTENLIILGDFNARVGSDFKTWTDYFDHLVLAA